jgi:hypothetical protein
VLSLAELQRDIARALVEGAELPAHPLVGGAQPRRRLAIHRRHFAASLAAALLQKFPACAWLTGAELIAAAAQAFVRAHPPRRPCIAEYGREFPVFLGAFDGAAARPELQSFAELEWAAGRASIAVDATPLAWPTLASLGVERLAAARLVLQPAVAYAASRWRIDDTLGAYLRGEPPHTPSAGQTYVEIRGARGELSLTRLDRATHAFRAALAGATIGAAAEDALEIDARFDVGAALHALVAAGLAIAVRTDEEL